jgi:hypothetical protein
MTTHWSSGKTSSIQTEPPQFSALPVVGHAIVPSISVKVFVPHSFTFVIILCSILFLYAKRLYI